jgi:pimeloyl-ACP methyl ester carboxylesterase/thiamine kinase-like enzyme
MDVVKANGLAIAYRRCGAGQPLVFVHGAAEDSRVWQPQLAGLADEFTVVAWDEPGAGRSSDVPPDFGLADYARCLAALIEALELGPAHVAGLSWGGTVVLELYRHRPALVATLILADTYAGWKGSLPEEELRARITGVRHVLAAPAGEFDPTLPGLFAHDPPTEFIPLLEEMAADVRRESFSVQLGILAAADQRDLLPCIDVPTLLIWGELDARSPLGIACQFAHAIPDSKLVVIADAGHVSNLEQPEQFNDAVREFCRSHSVRRGGNVQPARIPADDGVLSSEWLNGALAMSPNWPDGRFAVASATRIGVAYGLSGRIHRVVAETTSGRSITFVVKQEGAAEVERELLFRSHCGDALRRCIAECFAGASDSESGRGVLVLEDVAPAVQGDVLSGCTDAQAEAVLRALARVHAACSSVREDALPAALPRWRPAPAAADRWNDLLERARERFPHVLTSNMVAAICELPEQVESAVEQLNRGLPSWLHRDAHLDNVLWRADGSAVLLDWCNAAIGPPVVDVARFLTEGVVRSSEPERLEGLLLTYREELEVLGAAPVGLNELKLRFALALRPLLQSVVGWAGREDLELKGRTARLCANFLGSLCDWSTRSEYTLPMGR